MVNFWCPTFLECWLVSENIHTQKLQIRNFVNKKTSQLNNKLFHGTYIHVYIWLSKHSQLWKTLRSSLRATRLWAASRHLISETSMLVARWKVTFRPEIMGESWISDILGVSRSDKTMHNNKAYFNHKYLFVCEIYCFITFWIIFCNFLKL